MTFASLLLLLLHIFVGAAGFLVFGVGFAIAGSLAAYRIGIGVPVISSGFLRSIAAILWGMAAVIWALCGAHFLRNAEIVAVLIGLIIWGRTVETSEVSQ